MILANGCNITKSENLRGSEHFPYPLYIYIKKYIYIILLLLLFLNADSTHIYISSIKNINYCIKANFDRQKKFFAIIDKYWRTFRIYSYIFEYLYNIVNH